MDTILNRIEQIANNESIKITAFERIIGASKGVLSRAIANKTDIQSKWIQAIVENYPQYSAEWLLIGTGTMLREQAQHATTVSDNKDLIEKVCDLSAENALLRQENENLKKALARADGDEDAVVA